MKKYILSLRGINVRNIRIILPDLTLAFKNMGLDVVKTYLQTGNVVFELDKTRAEIKPILKIAFQIHFITNSPSAPAFII